MNYYMACYSCNERILVAQKDGGWTFYGTLPQCANELGDWLSEQALRECRPLLVEEANCHGLDERIWKRPAPQHSAEQ